MINDEQTQYDETLHDNRNAQTVMDDNSQNHTTGKKKKKGTRFAAGLGVAAAAGAGATILSGSTTKAATAEQETEAVAEQANLNEEIPAWSDGEVPVATGDYEDMSFSEAFAAARAEVGPGGAFEWHGKVYGTYLRDEWQNMSAEERAEYENHFSWSHHSSSSDHQNNLVQDDSHNGATIDDSEDFTAEVVEDESDATEGQTDEVPVVEVIGVEHSEELDANVAVVTVDDNEVMLVDVDNDESFDILTADVNGDGSVSENEVFDIRESNITVSDLGGFTESETAGMECMYGSPETEFHEVPDVDCNDIVIL